MNGAEVLALFELPEPEPERPPEDAVVAGLRDPGPVNDAVAGPMGWLLGLLAPTAPPSCVRCGTEHVYRTPAGFVLACGPPPQDIQDIPAIRRRAKVAGKKPARFSEDD